jgi:hypothetical protein
MSHLQFYTSFRPPTVLMYMSRKMTVRDAAAIETSRRYVLSLPKGKTGSPGAANSQTGEMTYPSPARCASERSVALSRTIGAPAAKLRARQPSPQWAHHFFIWPARPIPRKRSTNGDLPSLTDGSQKQLPTRRSSAPGRWIPACAGMTGIATRRQIASRDALQRRWWAGNCCAHAPITTRSAPHQRSALRHRSVSSPKCHPVGAPWQRS